MQIAFAYIGTVVGAGFATGQEIVQFFTQFGWPATLTIAVASVLFVVYGAQLMLHAAEIGARSYEDLNIHLFGKRLGKWISMITLIVLLAVTGVMLAGAGAIFEEHLHIPYSFGLLVTSALTLLVLQKGMAAILSVNSLVVPLMVLFAVILLFLTHAAPASDRWLHIPSDHHPLLTALSPLLYVAFNLWMAQAVLVPLGASIKKRRAIIWGSVGGGIGIGLLILVAHISMAPLMPGVRQFEIPMAHLIADSGWIVQTLFFAILFCEIFTTLIANVYGLCLQLEGRLRQRRRISALLVLAACYVLSLFGFKELLGFLYPLFGLLGLIWFLQLMRVGWRLQWRLRARSFRHEAK